MAHISDHVIDQALSETLTEIEQRMAANSAGEPLIDLSDAWANGLAPVGIVGGFARNRVVGLTAADMAHGTLRVLVPCKIVLCESIEFNPNAPALAAGRIDRGRSSDWFPDQAQEAYVGRDILSHAETQDLPGAMPTQAYRLGFFAAITIEHGDGTIIDLNGFRLGSHPHFAIQQRFHATIELANQPFIPTQGPAAFGPELRPARKVWIRNGTLGRSSHHGIHGNGMQDVLISDVTFVDFEVAAISLNGGRRIVIRDCQLEGTFDKVPVLGTYSSGRFVRLVGSQQRAVAKAWIDDPANAGNGQRPAIVAAHDALALALQSLDGAMDDMFDHAIGAGADAPPALFHNRTGLADANPYGIAIHARGVLVNAFLCNGPSFGEVGDNARAYECTDVVIRRTNIANIRGEVRETLALAVQPAGENDPQRGAPISDTAGSLFRFFGVRTAIRLDDAQPAEMDSSGRASLSVLGAAQIALADLEYRMVQADVMPDSRRLTRIPPEIIAWARTPQARIVRVSGARNRFRLTGVPGSDLRFTLQANGDSMFHVNKGAVGLFVQGVDGLTLDRVVVSGVRNTGWPGSDLAGSYVGPGDGGHKEQGRQIGYGGADARGVHVGACTHVAIADLSMSALTSEFGLASGISIAGGSAHVTAERLLFGDIRAGGGYAATGRALPMSRLPNLAPEAIGLFVDRWSVNVAVETAGRLGDIVAEPAGLQNARSVRMESSRAAIN